MADCHSRQNDMDYYSKQISKLIAELSTLPGIGAKSAQRLAFHILGYAYRRSRRFGKCHGQCPKRVSTTVSSAIR